MENEKFKKLYPDAVTITDTDTDAVTIRTTCSSDEYSEEESSDEKQNTGGAPLRRDYIHSVLEKLTVFLHNVRDKNGKKIPNTEKMITTMWLYQSNQYQFKEDASKYLLPFEDNLDNLLVLYLQKWDIDTASLRECDKQKVKRFLRCFCTICK